MLDFCGEHGIISDIELIKIQDINEACEGMLKSIEELKKLGKTDIKMNEMIN